MRPAERLLVELGISEARDIDLVAIAHCVGAEVQFRRLVGCEAEIIGFRDRAIIYVSDGTKLQRRRFSTGHELGHWHHHRGQSFVCRSDDIGRPTDERSKNAERVADAYSADLILPPFMIVPKMREMGEVALDGIIGPAQEFKTSLTAAAIRVMRMTRAPHIGRSGYGRRAMAMAQHNRRKSASARRHRFAIKCDRRARWRKQNRRPEEGAGELLVRSEARRAVRRPGAERAHGGGRGAHITTYPRHKDDQYLRVKGF